MIQNDRHCSGGVVEDGLEGTEKIVKKSYDYYILVKYVTPSYQKLREFVTFQMPRGKRWSVAAQVISEKSPKTIQKT